MSCLDKSSEKELTFKLFFLKINTGIIVKYKGISSIGISIE